MKTTHKEGKRERHSSESSSSEWRQSEGGLQEGGTVANGEAMSAATALCCDPFIMSNSLAAWQENGFRGLQISRKTYSWSVDYSSRDSARPQENGHGGQGTDPNSSNKRRKHCRCRLTTVRNTSEVPLVDLHNSTKLPTRLMIRQRRVIDRYTSLILTWS